MKKLFFCFIITIFFVTFCKAQDTIVFKSGKRIVGKVTSVDDFVNYTDSLGKKKYHFVQSLDYIHYATGEIYKRPTLPKLPIVNLACNVGYSDLIGGYGSTFNNPYDNEYCGFANGNVTANLTLNLRMGRHGWSFTVMSDYIRNTFNATGLLNEYGDGVIYPDAGNHTYDHFAVLGGFTKTWYYSSKKVYFGMRLMLGEFYFNFPKLNGTGMAESQNTITKQDTLAACNWNINHQVITEGVFQFGITIGQYLTRNWNLFESCDLLFGTKEDIGNPMVYISNINSNEIPIEGSYPNPAPYLAMFNFTGGIAYTFEK